MSRTPLAVALVAGVITLVAFTGTSRAVQCFNATIDGTQAGTGSPATGVGKFVLSDDELTLTYHVTFSGLGTAETASHIHSDAEAGGVVKSLGTGSPKIGEWKSTDGTPMTPARVADLKNGLLYVNIHSTGFPGGEIKGQILTAPCEEQCFDATIDGSQTGGSGSGTGTFVLNHTETELSYDISFSGLGTAETASHIHSNDEGGGVVKSLGTGSPKVGVWKFNDGTPLTPARVVSLKNGHLYVNIHSVGFPNGEIAGDIVTGACGPTGVTASPRATALMQNQPNPFNPSTTIAFTLARAAQARLDVYDVSGRHVATLVAGAMPAGRNEAAWDGRDRDGNAVSSGVYFYRLVADGTSRTRKMVLLK